MSQQQLSYPLRKPGVKRAASKQLADWPSTELSQRWDVLSFRHICAVGFGVALVLAISGAPLLTNSQSCWCL